MSSSPSHSTPPSYAAVERDLLARWPEHRVDPTLDRIGALCRLLGDPQRATPVVHLTGTNGKTSTARMVDGLLRGLGVRTGRFTSPHVESMRERIAVDGEPLSPERWVEAYQEVLPYAEVVDRSGEVPVSYFELVCAMAFATFADTPVETAVLEVGLGGRWDATNVADAQVAVVTTIDVDHRHLLGGTPEEAAQEKAGILKPGCLAVLAQQSVAVAEVLLHSAAQVSATVAREGLEFGVVRRGPGVGGQLLWLQGLAATYDEVFLPLYGAHQAQNAACAVAAVEGFLGGQALDPEVVAQALRQVTSPARLEVVRRSPTVVLDAAHNPHGVHAVAAAVEEAFGFFPLVGVVGVMQDKDVLGMLTALEPVVAHVVCTQNSTDRAMPAGELAAVAREVFDHDRVHVAHRLDDAVEAAAALADSHLTPAPVGAGPGVLVTGSVVTAGEARTLLGRA